MKDRENEYSIQTYCQGTINILQLINMVRHENASNMIQTMINNFNELAKSSSNHEVCLSNIRLLMGFDIDPAFTEAEKKLFNHALDNIEYQLNTQLIEKLKLDIFAESIPNLEITNEYLKSKILDAATVKSLWDKIKNDLVAEEKKLDPMSILEIKKAKPIAPSFATPHRSEIKKQVEEGSAKLADKIRKQKETKSTGITKHGIYHAKHPLSPRSVEQPFPKEKRIRKKY